MPVPAIIGAAKLIGGKIVASKVIGSAVVAGVGALAKGSAARKGKKKDQAFEAEENQKARDHEMALKQKEIDRYKNAIGVWSNYDTGATPLVRRQADPAVPVAGQAPAPGLLSTAYQQQSTTPRPPERQW